MTTLQLSKTNLMTGGTNVKNIGAFVLRFILIFPFALIALIGSYADDACDWLNKKLPKTKTGLIRQVRKQNIHDKFYLTQTRR